jgi:pimeloyl-ACP methyl ester carboxylesterase
MNAAGASLIALVHSPLTGPGAWTAVADALWRRGRAVAVPRLSTALRAGPSHYDAVAASVGRQITDAAQGEPVTLVAHSGAGALLPAIAHATLDVAGAVFVDALLPHPGESWFATAPRPLQDRLRSLAENGVLPKWSDWFPPATVARLLPDPERRERFIEELPRVPLSYFEESAPDPQEWPPPTCAYLRLSEAYEGQAEEAARRGWEVQTFDGDHLSILTDPDPIAELIARW